MRGGSDRRPAGSRCLDRGPRRGAAVFQLPATSTSSCYSGRAPRRALPLRHLSCSTPIDSKMGVSSVGDASDAQRRGSAAKWRTGGTEAVDLRGKALQRATKPGNSFFFTFSFTRPCVCLSGVIININWFSERADKRWQVLRAPVH